MQRERVKLRKMMYMRGEKRVDKVLGKKEESKAKNFIKEKKNRKQKDLNFNYCKEEVTMVIRRVLGCSYKCQSRKEKQKQNRQTKNNIPPWVKSKEILCEVPQKKKVKTHKRKQNGTPGNRYPMKVVGVESNLAMLIKGFEDSDPVLHSFNCLFTTKEDIKVMPGDFQGGGPAPGSSYLQVANFILLV